MKIKTDIFFSFKVWWVSLTTGMTKITHVLLYKQVHVKSCSNIIVYLCLYKPYSVKE